MEKDRPIISALALSGAMHWPLTLMDVHERLVRPASPRPSVGDVLRRLDALVAHGAVISALGMYALADADAQIFAGRIQREKECAQKWRRMRRYAHWLQAVPYAAALLASGSLALGSTGPDSDWDMFVVARAGRLYTARACLLAAARLMGRLRTKHDSVAPDKFCFNHYLTTDGLALRHHSLYVAHAVNMIVPVHDPEGWLVRLRAQNRWTEQWLALAGAPLTVRRTLAPSRPLDAVRRLLERLLNGRAGDWLERRLAAWQKSRIHREPATHEQGGRVTADEHELEFHPRSAEAAVLASYNLALIRHGFPDHAEADSGLTK